jgi:hypothetical protein
VRVVSFNAATSWFAGVIILAGCAPFRPSPHEATTRVPLGAPEVTAGQLRARALLGDVPARASRLGAGPPSLVASGEALDNEWLGAFVQVPPELCMLAYARASSSVEDVDVAVYSDEGTSVAVDEARDVHPTVLVCPPHPIRVYVAAHVVEGEGLVAVGAQLVAREQAAAVAHGLAVRGALGQGTRAADAWPGLDEAVRSHRLELGGKWEEFKRVALPVDVSAPTYASMPVDADQCVDAVIVPDDDVALLDVEATDDQGRVVARAREGMGPRSMTLCSPVPMAGTLSVRPHAGRGLVAIVLARAGGDVARDLSERPAIVWMSPTRSLEVAKRATNALLAKSGYPPPASTASGVLALGRRASLPLELGWLGSSSCGRIDVVAGAPLSLLEARVWGAGDALLASGEASSSLALFACTRGPARLELEARGRPGPYAVLVRPEPWKEPSFTAHPLASSRMLARAAVGEAMLLPGKDGAARELALDASRLVTWTETVPAGRCLRVTVGAQGDGSGIEIRAFEPRDVEIDRAEAAHAAAVRACAPQDASRIIRFEMRASAGHLDSVVGERIDSTDGH